MEKWKLVACFFICFFPQNDDNQIFNVFLLWPHLSLTASLIKTFFFFYLCSCMTLLCYKNNSLFLTNSVQLLLTFWQPLLIADSHSACAVSHKSFPCLLPCQFVFLSFFSQPFCSLVLILGLTLFLSATFLSLSLCFLCWPPDFRCVPSHLGYVSTCRSMPSGVEKFPIVCVCFLPHSFGDLLSFTLTAFVELMDHGIVSWDTFSVAFIKKVSQENVTLHKLCIYWELFIVFSF